MDGRKSTEKGLLEVLEVLDAQAINCRNLDFKVEQSKYIIKEDTNAYGCQAKQCIAVSRTAKMPDLKDNKIIHQQIQH